jgi:hypothetical protein
VLAATALISAAVLPASAQMGAIPPHEVMTIVRSIGLRPVSRPMWRAGRYVLRAMDRRGRELSVTVDGRSGEIRSVARIMPEMMPGYIYEDAAVAPRVYSTEPLGSAPPPLEGEDEYLPPRNPPAVIRAPNAPRSQEPAARSRPQAPARSAAPSNTARVTPAVRTPLPSPRATVPDNDNASRSETSDSSTETAAPERKSPRIIPLTRTPEQNARATGANERAAVSNPTALPGPDAHSTVVPVARTPDSVAPARITPPNGTTSAPGSAAKKDAAAAPSAKEFSASEGAKPKVPATESKSAFPAVTTLE